MPEKQTFMDLVMAEKATIDDLDDYVDKWHEGDGEGLPLHTYLGMTRNEYFKLLGGKGWKNETLELIIQGRKVTKLNKTLNAGRLQAIDREEDRRGEAHLNKGLYD